MNNGTLTEAEIAAVSTAPRITPADIEANIASTWYINGATGVVPDNFQPPPGASSPLNVLTICVLVLRNGFTVTGESACASPENYNADIGRCIARENAVEKVWTLMGYELKERLYQRTVPPQAPVWTESHPQPV